MGCASSASDAPSSPETPVASKPSSSLGDLNAVDASSSPAPALATRYLVRLRGGPLSQDEYNARLFGVRGARRVEVPYDDEFGRNRSFVLRYASCSQRGYYPEAAEKPNQDAFAALERFRDREDEFVFGVFDGHGENGTECANFAKIRVPEELMKREFGNAEAYAEAFEATNAALRASEVDDSLSGTTAIVAHLRGRDLYVINVGDSRATMGMAKTLENGGESVEACDLSFDQTPFRSDECARVKELGARVLTLDQLEGFKDPNVQCWGTEQDDDGDPPRLWAKNGMYPGTAFTRSIGDAIAERIGVIATPEVEHVRLSKHTKCVVVASDGVFEFIPSARVVSTVLASDDPQESAISLVVESYKLWLQYETRTDDITVIVLLFEGFFDEEAEEPKSPLQSVQSVGAMFNFTDRAAETSPSAPLPSSARPSRRVMPTFTMQTRRSYRVVHPYGMSSDYHFAAVASASALAARMENLSISDADASKLVAIFKTSFLFHSVSNDVLERLARSVFKIKVSRGDVVLSQNDKTCLRAFYAVESGTYTGVDNLKWGDDKVNEKMSSRSYGQEGERMCFNEQCLAHGQLPHETVTADTDGVLCVLDLATFERVIRGVDDVDVVNLTRALRGVESLKAATLSNLREIATNIVADRANSLVRAQTNEIIMHQGQQLDAMHVIRSGKVLCTVRANVRDASETPRVVLQLASDQYFCERALSGSGVCATNIQAVSEVEIWKISRGDVEAVLGPSAPIARASSLSNLDGGGSAAQVALKTKLPREPPERRMSFGDDDRSTREALYVTLLGHMREMKGLVREATVQLSIARTESLGRVQGVLRERSIIKLLTSDTVLPPSFIPRPGLPQRDSSFISVPYPFVPRCALEAAIACGGGSKPAVVRYYAGSLTLALEYIHKFDIVFRGIDPETMIISETGALRLVDFRFAKRLTASDASPGRTFTACGAAAYMAPEVVAGTGHDERADWFSLGAFIAHMLRGSPPFGMMVRRETFDAICSGDVSKVFRDDAIPEAVDLARALLVVDPTKRLATARAVKQHAFFAAVDFDALAADKPPPEVEALTRDQYRGRGVPPIRDATEPSASSAAWSETYMAFDSIAP